MGVGFAGGDEEDEGKSYLTLLKRVILALPENSIQNRRKVYEKTEAMQKALLESQTPERDEDEVDFEFRLLRNTIRMLEADLRNGVDIGYPGYRPDGYDEMRRQLIESFRARKERRERVVAKSAKTARAALATEAARAARAARVAQAAETSQAARAARLAQAAETSQAARAARVAQAAENARAAREARAAERQARQSPRRPEPRVARTVTVTPTEKPRVFDQAVPPVLGPSQRGEHDTVEQLRQGLRFIDPEERDSKFRFDTPGPIRIVRALLVYQFQSIAGESRFAIPWMLVQPAVLLALISSMYFITGTRYILNMDVPTFALMGAGTWIMCRQVIFRVSTTMAHNRVLINLPSVTPFMQAVTQALLYLLIYVVSLVLLVAAGRLVDLTSLPAHWVGVSYYLFGMWVFALAMGLLFGVLALYWPYFLRLASVIERALQMFSSVYFVTEQMPTEYRAWVLWCPTSHGLQLLRASYFDGYPSTDASAWYFWLSILFFICSMMAAERIMRPYIQPL